MSIHLEGMAPLLQVFDMPTSLHFYRNMLGFTVQQSAGEGDEVDWVLLSLGDIQLMLNTAYEKPDRPAKPEEGRMVAHSDTSLYFGCPNVEATYQALVVKGLKLEPPSITSYGWKALYLQDPDGYQLCFHWPLDERG